MSFEQRLIQHWYGTPDSGLWWLHPLSWLFAGVSYLRRALYRWGGLSAYQPPVPLIVIGNLTVGGVGKTPLTLHLLAALRQRGWQVGVVSRGYGGMAQQPQIVLPSHTANHVGDEPLLYAQAGFPVAIGRQRAAAVRTLLAAYPQLDLLLADDGLQHYALGRTLEVVVIDGAQGLGNGRLLPAGPLRESAARLATVHALVVHQTGDLPPRLPDLPPALPRFTMRLTPAPFYALSAPHLTRSAADFAGLKVVALAGIGHPPRFFATLTALGLVPVACHAFPDHHRYTVADLPAEADAIVVTEKDAVKLRGLDNGKLWVLPVAATLMPDLADWLTSTLKKSVYGQQTA